MSFSERLKEARKKKNLSQTDIANYLKKKTTAISQWEHGRTEPCIKDLKKLTEVLDVTIEYLLEIETKQPKPPIAYTFEEDLKRLNQKGIDKVTDFIKVLKDHPIYSTSFTTFVENEKENVMSEFKKILNKLKIIHPDLYDWITIRSEYFEDNK